MKKLTMVMSALALCAISAYAVDMELLSWQEQARYGATHAVELEAADFSAVTTANAAATNTVTLTGPLAWEYRGFSLDLPFNDTKTYGTNGCATTTNSIAVTVTLDSLTLVNGLQVAGDQTRAYKAWLPTALTLTATPTLTTRVLTNVVYESGTVTGNVTVATGAASVANSGTWAYAGNVTNGATATLTWITGAPGAASSLGNLTRGKARVFLRILN
jgi:hypothetical protein